MGAVYLQVSSDKIYIGCIDKTDLVPREICIVYIPCADIHPSVWGICDAVQTDFKQISAELSYLLARCFHYIGDR